MSDAIVHACTGTTGEVEMVGRGDIAVLGGQQVSVPGSSRVTKRPCLRRLGVE